MWRFWIIAFCASVMDAQRFPDRWIVLNPLLDTTRRVESGKLSWMHSLSGWGEFGGYPRGDSEHAWIQRLGAIIELVRIGENASLAFASEIEFIANPHNDIRFNPRAIFWQEGFLLTHRAGKNYWQIGYYHRCKHDVDNLEAGRQRSLIYGSLLGKYIVPFYLTELPVEGVAVIRGDLYTIRQDARTPLLGLDENPNLRRMIGTLGGSAHLRGPLGGSLLGFFAMGWLGTNLYGDRAATYPVFDRVRTITVQGGIGGGIAITGAAHFRIGIAYEYLADTGINPLPERAHLVSLTIAVLNPVAMW